MMFEMKSIPQEEIKVTLTVSDMKDLYHIWFLSKTKEDGYDFSLPGRIYEWFPGSLTEEFDKYINQGITPANYKEMLGRS